MLIDQAGKVSDGKVSYKVCRLGIRPCIGLLAVRVGTFSYQARTDVEIRKNRGEKERGEGGEGREREAGGDADGGRCLCHLPREQVEIEKERRGWRKMEGGEEATEWVESLPTDCGLHY